MFIKDNKRINLNVPQIIDGVTYQDIRRFPEVMASHNIVDIPEDPAPADYSDDTYYRTEDWETTQRPYTVYTRKSDEQIAQVQQQKLNATSLAYLVETDWMVTRFAETGVSIPDDVKTKRQAARDSIVNQPV